MSHISCSEPTNALLLPLATCTPKLRLVTAQAALKASTTRDEKWLATAALNALNTGEQQLHSPLLFRPLTLRCLNKEFE